MPALELLERPFPTAVYTTRWWITIETEVKGLWRCLKDLGFSHSMLTKNKPLRAVTARRGLSTSSIPFSSEVGNSDFCADVAMPQGATDGASVFVTGVLCRVRRPLVAACRHGTTHAEIFCFFECWQLIINKLQHDRIWPCKWLFVVCQNLMP